MTDQTLPIDLLGRVLDQLGRLIDNVQPDQAGDATPCAEWDVRQLVSHVVSSVARNGAWVHGGPAPRPHDLAVGEDWASQYRAAAGHLLAGWGRPGAASSTFATPLGEVPAARLLELQGLELGAHAWDLAQATSQINALDQALAEAILPLAERLLPADRRGAGCPVGPAVPVADDARAYDRLAAFLGRQP